MLCGNISILNLSENMRIKVEVLNLKKFFFLIHRLTEAEELQLTVVKEKTKLEMKYQDEIEMAKVSGNECL